MEVEKHPNRSRDYKIANGELYVYKKNTMNSDLIENLDAWKLVVPKGKCEKILNESHDVPNAVHTGIERTYVKMKRKYFWPLMYKNTRKYVRSCLICQSNTTVSRYFCFSFFLPSVIDIFLLLYYFPLFSLGELTIYYLFLTCLRFSFRKAEFWLTSSVCASPARHKTELTE